MQVRVCWSTGQVGLLIPQWPHPPGRPLCLWPCSRMEQALLGRWTGFPLLMNISLQGGFFKKGSPSLDPEVGPLQGGPPSSRSTVHPPEQGPANGSKGHVENIFGFTGHMVSVAITEICHYGSKAPCTVPKGMGGVACVPVKVYLGALKCVFHFMVMCHETVLFPCFFSQPLENVKTILNSQATQKQAMGLDSARGPRVCQPLQIPSPV